MAMSTGIKRLDALLSGGLPERSVTLLYGPPFIGKRMIGHLFLLEGMAQGIPAIVVNTDATVNELRGRFSALNQDFLTYEKKGLCHFVDTYSKSIGAADGKGNVEYVDGLMNFNAISVAVNNAQRAIIKQHAEHRLLFDSVSTLVAHTNGQAAFRFLQVLTGKSKMAGATAMMVLEAGMHADPEVQAMKHLASGVIALHREKGKNLMEVEGLGLPGSVGPVEYEVSEMEFVVTGSFEAGRIR